VCVSVFIWHDRVSSMMTEAAGGDDLSDAAAKELMTSFEGITDDGTDAAEVEGKAGIIGSLVFINLIMAVM
jgi:hypothetical protein